MTNLVPADEIESIVGVPRHETAHIGRAVSASQTVFIMHSRECLRTQADLRDCPFSQALDVGILVERWTEDVAVPLTLQDGRLEPDRS